VEQTQGLTVLRMPIQITTVGNKVHKQVPILPPSPLQKKITDLCARAVATNDLSEFKYVACELKAALREQVAILRSMVDDAKQTIAQLPAEWPITEDKKKRKVS
jgi:hypothetical protein